jgi:acyl-[acyl carrier protein]--UDP-N-acetylglucosamine O-acyltransferase
MIGIGSAVTKDTLPYSLMVGNPARLKNFVCHCGCELKRLIDENMTVKFRCVGCNQIMAISFKWELTKND